MGVTAHWWAMSVPVTMGRLTMVPVSNEPDTYRPPRPFLTAKISLADIDANVPNPDGFSGDHTLAVPSKLAGLVGSPPFQVPQWAGVTSLNHDHVMFSPMKVVALGPW